MKYQKKQDAFLKLKSDNEQDAANAKAWWLHLSSHEKMQVWYAIQSMPDDGVIGMICRLAQLKFSELAEGTQ